MKKIQKVVYFMFLFSLIILTINFIPIRSTIAGTDIRIVTASIGGSWYPIGGTLAGIISKNIPDTNATVTTGGGIANIINVGNKKAEIGLAHPGSILEAIKGEGQFKGKPITNIRAITALYPAVLHIGVRIDSGINSIEDLKGKVLCVPTKGNVAEEKTRFVLEIYGLSYKDFKKVNFVGYSDAADLIRDGHADVLTAIGSVPFPALYDLSKSKGLKLLSIDDSHFKKIVEKSPAYVQYNIPANLYKGTEKITKAIATNTLIITRDDMPEDLIYNITKLLYKHKEDFVSVVKQMKNMTLENGPKTGNIQLHPGSEKFFKENK